MTPCVWCLDVSASATLTGLRATRERRGIGGVCLAGINQAEIAMRKLQGRGSRQAGAAVTAC